MKVFIAATLLLSVMVGFLSHDYLIVSHDQVIYEIPLIYPIMLIIWLFFAGFVLGYQKLSWRQYWLTRKISSYEHLIDVVCQQRDEARWLVCEISRGAIPLRLQEMAADYDMIESPHSTELSAYRLVGYNQKQNNTSLHPNTSHVLVQALQEERLISVALQCQDGEGCHASIALLQELPWDLWKDRQAIHKILASWREWEAPVQLFLLSKISPVFWHESQISVLFDQIEHSKNRHEWVKVLRKQGWGDAIATLYPAKAFLLEQP